MTNQPITKQNKNIGNIARAFLSLRFIVSAARNAVLANTDQNMAKILMAKWKANETSEAPPNIFNENSCNNAAITSGNRQQPSTHMDWKKLILPDSSLVFIVTTMAPTVNSANSEANSGAFSSTPLLPCSKIERKTNKLNGPHRSQSKQNHSHLI